MRRWWLLAVTPTLLLVPTYGLFILMVWLSPLVGVLDLLVVVAVVIVGFRAGRRPMSDGRALALPFAMAAGLSVVPIVIAILGAEYSDPPHTPGTLIPAIVVGMALWAGGFTGVEQAVARRGPATGTVIAIAGGAALLPIALYAQVTLTWAIWLVTDQGVSIIDILTQDTPTGQAVWQVGTLFWVDRMGGASAAALLPGMLFVIAYLVGTAWPRPFPGPATPASENTVASADPADAPR